MFDLEHYSSVAGDFCVHFDVPQIIPQNPLWDPLRGKITRVNLSDSGNKRENDMLRNTRETSLAKVGR